MLCCLPRPVPYPAAALPPPPADHSAELPYAKTVTVFKDPNEIKRSVSYLHWSPDGAHKVAAAYNILEFQMMPAGMSLNSYVWDLANPNVPDFELHPTSQLTAIKFNQKDPNIVAGGQYNGQVRLRRAATHKPNYQSWNRGRMIRTTCK